MKKIHNYMSVMMMAVAAVAMTACEKQEPEQQTDGDGVLTIRFEAEPWGSDVTSSFGEARTRGSLQADGKALTDFWLLDYMGDELKSEIHQTSDQSDFAEPTVQFAYGEHTIYFIASRGTSPVLLTDDKTITWEKPLDTFYKKLSLTVSKETATSQAVTLERIVTMLRVHVTDAPTEGTATFTVTPKTWYYGMNYATLEPVAAKADAPRTANLPASYIGKEDSVTVNIYGFCSQDGFNTDIHVSAADSQGVSKGEATVTAAQFKVNHISQYSGALFSAASRSAGFVLSLSSEWGEKIEGTW